MRYQGIAIGAGLFAGWPVFALFLRLVAAAPLPATAKVALVNTHSATFSVPVRSWKTLRDARIVKQNLDYSCGAASFGAALKRGRIFGEAAMPFRKFL